MVGQGRSTLRMKMAGAMRPPGLVPGSGFPAKVPVMLPCWVDPGDEAVGDANLGASGEGAE